MKAIDKIYSNLKNGMIYASYMDNVRFPGYWYVLSYDRIKNLFHYRNYGSSAIKATKKDLVWLLDTIFEMEPETFIEKYHCVDQKTYYSA